MDDAMVSPIGHNELFAEVFHAHEIKIDALKLETGAGNAQIDGWLSGARVIPIGAWISLYRLTGDQRVGTIFSDAHQRHRETMPAPQVLPTFLACLREMETCAKELHAICEDGAITDADQPRINRFTKHKRCLVDIADLCESALLFHPHGDQE